MSTPLFITGTDTDIGKTYVSCLLLRALKHAGYRTVALKPIASGCERHQDDLYNHDALQLQRHASENMTYAQINPFRFEQPIAPHIAAEKNNRVLTGAAITNYLSCMQQHPSDITLIEGVGGWHVPLNDSELLSEVIGKQKMAVILVIGLQLGCINHGILTARAIQQSGGALIGWIGNRIDPNMLVYNENMHTLKHWVEAPCLGVVSFNNSCISQINMPLLRQQLFHNAGVAVGV